MAIIVSDTGGGDFKPAPEGTHFGVCDMVVDLGHQRTTYKGQEKIKPQLYVRWQVPAERVEWEDRDGNKQEGPMVIGKTYTQSLSDRATLRKDLETWRTRAFTQEELRGFDVSKLLGVPATITVTHKKTEDRTYANVSGVGGIPKGMTPPKAEGSPILYDSENVGSFDELPQWLRDKIQSQVPQEEVGNADPHDPDAWRSEMEPAEAEVPF